MRVCNQPSMIAIAASVFAVVAMAQTAVPAKTETKKEPVKTAAKKTGPASQGMIISVDPVTKQIRQPDASEMQVLTGSSVANIAVGEQPLRMIQGPGNAVGVVLPPSMMVYSVATKSAEGKLKMDCVTGDKAAEQKLQQGGQVKKEVLDVQ